MARKIKIAVGIDHLGWHQKFAQALDVKIAQRYPLDYSIIDMETHDWQIKIEPFDVVIWNPSYMGPISAKYLKEKVYLIENFMGKTIYPNWASVWHFESKIAESYIFSHSNIKTPRTTITFNYRDAMDQIRESTMPIVWKVSHGAGSENVRLIRTLKKAENQISKSFCQSLWTDAKKQYPSRISLLLHALGKPWFWEKVRYKLINHERYGYAYWQEFIPDNPHDLRVTVIGDHFAYGFWRNNRPHDFRASGSGRIDYQLSVPEPIIQYCMSQNRLHDFNSMCYDILLRGDDFVITEMSYTYRDRALYEAKGYYELMPDSHLEFHEGHTWPQILWVEWAMCKLNLQNY